jgi:hypothetical protein
VLIETANETDVVVDHTDYDLFTPDRQADDPWLPYQPRPRWNTGPIEELNGFQTPPVNWTINSPFKRAFFSRVAEVTGYPGKGEQA